MTNREWMATLTDEQLSKFLTDGLLLRYKFIDATGSVYTIESFISISFVFRRYTHSQKGLEQWLSAPQEFSTV